MKTKEINTAEIIYENFINTKIGFGENSDELNNHIITQFIDDCHCDSDLIMEIKENITKLNFNEQVLYFERISNLIDLSEDNYGRDLKRYNIYKNKYEKAERIEREFYWYHLLCEDKKNCIDNLRWFLDEIRIFDYNKYSNEFFLKFFKKIEMKNEYFEYEDEYFIEDFIDDTLVLLNGLKREIENNCILLQHKDKYFKDLNYKLNNFKLKIENQKIDFDISKNDYQIYRNYYKNHLKNRMSREDNSFYDKITIILRLKLIDPALALENQLNDCNKLKNKVEESNDNEITLESLCNKLDFFRKSLNEAPLDNFKKFDEMTILLNKPMDENDFVLAKRGVENLVVRFKLEKLKFLKDLEEFIKDLGFYENITDENITDDNEIKDVGLSVNQSLILFDKLRNIDIEIWDNIEKTRKARIISKLINKNYDNIKKGLNLLDKKKSDIPNQFKSDIKTIDDLLNNTLFE